MDVLDCRDHSCYFAVDKSGQRTNGGCRCLKELPGAMRSLIFQAIRIKERAARKEEREHCLMLIECSIPSLRALAPTLKDPKVATIHANALEEAGKAVRESGRFTDAMEARRDPGPNDRMHCPGCHQPMPAQLGFCSDCDPAKKKVETAPKKCGCGSTTIHGCHCGKCRECEGY